MPASVSPHCGGVLWPSLLACVVNRAVAARGTARTTRGHRWQCERIAGKPIARACLRRCDASTATRLAGPGVDTTNVTAPALQQAWRTTGVLA